MRMIYKLAFVCALVAASAFGQWSDFNPYTGSSNLVTFMNSKITYQSYPGDPNGHLAGTASRDHAWDTNGLAEYICVVTGGSTTAVWTKIPFQVLVPSNNLTDLTSAPAARTALGLGTAATANTSALFQLGSNNTVTTGAQDFSSALSLRIPNSVNCTSPLTLNGHICYNTTSNAFQGYVGATVKTFAFLDSTMTGAWQGTVVAPVYGGSGVANTATETRGSANVNWATLATGLVFHTVTTGAKRPAVFGDITSLFGGGTCSGFLKDDGTCGTGTGSGPSNINVSFSATPTFTVGATTTIQVFNITLTGDVTSSTLNTTNASAGQDITFNICDTAGGHLFAFPANVTGAGTVVGEASTCSRQTFRWDGTNAVAVTNMTCPACAPGLKLPGAVSGVTNIIPPATGGGAATVFPGSDTFVGKATTDTFTNKTIDVSGAGNVIKLSSVNPQTATYQVLASDFSGYKTIAVASGTFTITLVASGSQPTDGQYINVVNYGSGVITIARSGQNINGGVASMTLNAGSATAPTAATITSNGTNYVARLSNPGGSTSPLTTKGDIYVYGTADARLPVGTNGQALVADSTQTLGLKFASLGTSATGAPYTQSFTGQTSVALTHNLALSPVTAYVLECFDGSGVRVQPGNETATNLNTVTVTFSVAQTGSCTVATGGSGGGSPAVGSITGAGAAGHYPRSNGSIYVDGVIQAADVPPLNQSTTGTAANLSGTPALPNGTTATTQTAGDNTTKLATTAFVTTAVAGGGGTSAVFAGSTADTIASSATPAFSFAAQSSKSPTVRKFTPVVNVTGPTFTNLTAGARVLLYITTDGTHTWSWNSTVADNICNVWTQSAGTTIAEVFVDPDGSTLHGGVCTGGPAGLLSLVTEGATCSSNPASGALCIWADSTDHTVKAKDSSGNVTVLPRSAGSRTANQFATHIPSTGILATAAIAGADLPATTVQTNQGNTYSTGDQDFGSASTLKVPVAAGATATVNGRIKYDSTNNMLHAAQGGADSFVPQFTTTPANDDCAKWVVSGSNYKLGTTGAPCGSGSAGVTSFNTRTGAVTGAAGDIPETVNAQTGTTYTVVAGDAGKIVTLSNAASIAVTLPQAGGSFPAGWSVTLSSIGAGTVTVTPTTSTIGGAATITLEIGEWAKITSDGTNYEVRTNRVTAGSNVTLTKSRAGGVSVAASGASAITHQYGGAFGSPGGTALTTSMTTYFVIPSACTINAWNILVDAGTATVKFWKIARGTAIPTSGNSINTSGVAISTGTAVHSTTVSDFTTTTVTAGDIGAVTITAVSGATFLVGTFECQ